MKLVLFLVPFLLVAQETEKTFTFEHAKTLEEATSLAQALKTVGEMSAQASETSLAVTGTPAQIELAAWAVSKLDAHAGPAQHVVSADFTFGDDRVRIFRIANAPTKQVLMEMATAIRSVCKIRYVYAMDWNKSWIMRGPAVDLDAAEWVWNQIDRAGPVEGIATYKRPMPANPTRDDLQDTFVVTSVARPRDVREFQEVATALRSITEMPFLFSYNLTKTVVARGAGTQLEMMKWLVRQLDQPPAASGSPSYHSPAVDDSIHLFYLPETRSVSEFQAQAKKIREEVGIRRAFTYNRDRALLVRGTAAELARVQELAQALPK